VVCGVADVHEKRVAAVVAQLVAAREKAGVSQVGLSRKCGLSRSGLSHIENGRAQPTLLSLYKIAEALDVELAPILEGVAQDQ